MVTEAAQESLQKTTTTPTNADTSSETEFIDIPEIPPPLVVKGDLDIANGPQEQPVKVWVSPDTPLSFISGTLARRLCTPIPLRNQQQMRGQINGLLTHGVKGRVVVDDIRYDGPFVVAPHDLPLGVDVILGHESIKPQMRKIDWEWLAEQAKLTWDAVAAEEATHNKNTEANNIDNNVNVNEDNVKNTVHNSTTNDSILEKNNPIPKTNVPKANTDDSIANSNNIKVEHTMNETRTDENDAEMTIDDNNLKVDETNNTSNDMNIFVDKDDINVRVKSTDNDIDIDNVDEANPNLNQAISKNEAIPNINADAKNEAIPKIEDIITSTTGDDGNTDDIDIDEAINDTDHKTIKVNGNSTNPTLEVDNAANVDSTGPIADDAKIDKDHDMDEVTKSTPNVNDSGPLRNDASPVEETSNVDDASAEIVDPSMDKNEEHETTANPPSTQRELGPVCFVSAEELGRLTRKINYNKVCFGSIRLYYNENKPKEECDIGITMFRGAGKWKNTTRSDPNLFGGKAVETMMRHVTDREVKDTLAQYSDVFSTRTFDQETGELWNLSEQEVSILTNTVRKLIREGSVKPTTASTYTPQIHFLRKTRDTFAMCIDCRGLSPEMDRYIYQSKPNSSVLRALVGRRLMSRLKTTRISPVDGGGRNYTRCYSRIYEYAHTRIPFNNDKVALMQTVDSVLYGVPGGGIKVYMDEIIIATDNVSAHVTALREVLRRLQNAKIVLDPASCRFLSYRGTFMGYELSSRGLTVPQAVKREVLSLAVPRTPADYASVLPLFDFYKTFVSQYAYLVQRLHRAADGSDIGATSVEAFEAIVQSIATSTGLKPAVPRVKCIIQLFVADNAVGADVFQYTGQTPRCVGKHSIVLGPKEAHLPMYQKETIALLEAFKVFKVLSNGDRPMVVKYSYRGVDAKSDHSDGNSHRSREPSWLTTRLERLYEPHEVDDDKLGQARKVYAPSYWSGRMDATQRELAAESEDLAVIAIYATLTHTKFEVVNKRRFADLLRSDPSVSVIHQICSEGGKRDDPEERDIVRQFHVDDDGLLWRSHRLVLPQYLVRPIIDAQMDMITQGPLETWWALVRTFYVPDLYREIRLMTVSEAKGLNIGDFTQYAHLVPKLFHTIHLELCKPMGQGSSDDAGVVVAVCSMSRLTIYIPCLHPHTPSQLYSLLETHVFDFFGIPEEIITSDTNYWRHFREHDIAVTVAQKDGSSVGKSVYGAVNHIKALMAAKPTDWHHYLSIAQYVVNAAYKCGLGMSAMEALHGRAPHKMSRLRHIKRRNTYNTHDLNILEVCWTQEAQAAFIDRVEAVDRAIATHTRLENSRSLEFEDEDPDNPKFAVGDLVFVSDTNDGKPSTTSRYGPFMVLGRATDRNDSTWNVDIDGDIYQVDVAQINKYSPRKRYTPTPQSSMEVMKRPNEIVGVPQVIFPHTAPDREGWVYLQFKGCQPFDYARVRPNLVGKNLSLQVRQLLLDKFSIGGKPESEMRAFRNIAFHPHESVKSSPASSARDFSAGADDDSDSSWPSPVDFRGSPSAHDSVGVKSEPDLFAGLLPQKAGTAARHPPRPRSLKRRLEPQSPRESTARQLPKRPRAPAANDDTNQDSPTVHQILRDLK
ncbi:hypothetical protein DIURU_003138 [Diutina rugosa]|uniref:Integrase catalytic domain-containing protein n=1 Tax=Diutina rugosa TaxID=5481 RepID=A0A642UM95_DIURU|nr:uncharacterized protein DIURU_003138 [Diutina rugosa]KAA8901610.1 hypothetical protein DIURU_003138 [Diutina rugosa]